MSALAMMSVGVGVGLGGAVLAGGWLMRRRVTCDATAVPGHAGSMPCRCVLDSGHIGAHLCNCGRGWAPWAQ